MFNENHAAGLAAEYFAASRFAALGYEVWWPSSAHTPVDFAISKPRGPVLRVQVKKASKRKGRTEVVLRRSNGDRQYRPGDFDYLVAVDGTRVWAIPFQKVHHRTRLTLDRETDKKMKLTYNPDAWLLK